MDRVLERAATAGLPAWDREAAVLAEEVEVEVVVAAVVVDGVASCEDRKPDLMGAQI